MRLFTLLTLGIVLAATPAMADKGSILAGSITCRQNVPCSGNSSLFSAEKWAEAGNLCLQQAFGLRGQESIVDEYAGVDSNGNLTIKAEALPKRTGPRLLPHCYTLESSEGTCFIHCDLQKQ